MDFAMAIWNLEYIVTSTSMTTVGADVLIPCRQVDEAMYVNPC